MYKHVLTDVIAGKYFDAILHTMLFVYEYDINLGSHFLSFSFTTRNVT